MTPQAGLDLPFSDLCAGLDPIPEPDQDRA